MKIQKIIITLLLFGRIFCSVETSAQCIEKNVFRDFEFIQNSDVRLLSTNPTGLHYFPITHISMAEADALMKRGKLIDYYQSNNSLASGIKTESYYRISPRISTHGLVSYRYFEGKNMGGSAFIDPVNAPFNIVEYSDTTRGVKQKETYRLLGGIGYDAWNGLKLGANIDYTAANYAKRKDLRHRNKMLDFVASTGVSYPVTPNFEIGATYSYRKRVEGVYFDMYGTTDKQYNILVDFGSFYGRREGFSELGDGYMPGKKERPLVDNYHEVGLQTNWQIFHAILFYSNVFYRNRSGYYGIKSSSSIVFSSHNGQTIGYEGALSLKNNSQQHSLRLSIEREKLNNFENVYKIINVEGGVSHVEYYGKNRRLYQIRRNLHIGYELNMGIENFLPKYTLNLSVRWQNRRRTTSIYPYFRKQNINFGNLSLDAKRNIISKKNLYTISVGFLYATGNGDICSDGTYVQPNPKETPPMSTPFNLEKEYVFLTKTRIGVRMSFRYSFRTQTKLLPYAQIYCAYNQTVSGLPKLNSKQVALNVGFYF